MLVSLLNAPRNVFFKHQNTCVEYSVPKGRHVPGICALRLVCVASLLTVLLTSQRFFSMAIVRPRPVCMWLTVDCCQRENTNGANGFSPILPRLSTLFNEMGWKQDELTMYNFINMTLARVHSYVSCPQQHFRVSLGLNRFLSVVSKRVKLFI